MALLLLLGRRPSSDIDEDCLAFIPVTLQTKFQTLPTSWTFHVTLCAVGNCAESWEVDTYPTFLSYSARPATL